MIKPVIKIDGRWIGDDYPPYVVAEMSCNHGGDFNRALKMVRRAAYAGAHAIKLQTFCADTMTINSDRPEFEIKDGPWAGRKLYELYDEAKTPWPWHKALFAEAKNAGITMFSSVFDESSVDFLEQFDCPAYKISSFEIIDIPLIRYAAQTGKPIILSAGMASYEEIMEAAAAVNEARAPVAVLHCVSAYPASVEAMNLRLIPVLKNGINGVGGLSDHSLGDLAATTAVALGANIIEKHFTLDPSIHTLDSSFSIGPQDLSGLCIKIKATWKSIGRQGDSSKDQENNKNLRRSLYFISDMKAGEEITKRHVKSIRPGLGLPPKYIDWIIGKKVTKDVERGEPVQWESIETVEV